MPMTKFLSSCIKKVLDTSCVINYDGFVVSTLVRKNPPTLVMTTSLLSPQN